MIAAITVVVATFGLIVAGLATYRELDRRQAIIGAGVLMALREHESLREFVHGEYRAHTEHLAASRDMAAKLETVESAIVGLSSALHGLTECQVGQDVQLRQLAENVGGVGLLKKRVAPTETLVWIAPAPSLSQ